MANTIDDTVQVDGPHIDKQSGAQSYTVHGQDEDIHFSVWPKASDDSRTVWEASIEGVPGPGIVHEDAWTTPEQAYGAALQAIKAMVGLERLQHVDAAESAHVESSESCEDQTGAVEVEDGAF